MHIVYDVDNTCIFIYLSTYAGCPADFHQPLPSGMLAVFLNRCARLCGKNTTIWRDALSTVMELLNPELSGGSEVSTSLDDR